MRILGEEEVASDHVSLLALPGAGPTVAVALAAWISKEEGVAWDTLDLNGVDADHPSLCLFFQRLTEMGHAIHSTRTVSCWSVTLPGDWNTFVARCSKNHRKRIRKAERTILDTPRANFRVPRDADELRTAYAILVDLHQRRRRMLGEPGYFDSPDLAAFLEEATGLLFAEGNVVVPWLEIDGVPAAAEYLLLGGGTVFAYQCGMNPDLAAISPGSLAQTAVIRWAVRSGFMRYDLLRGDEPYKTARCRPRARRRVYVFSRLLEGRMRHQLCAAGYAVKQTVKSGLSWIGYE